MHLINFCLFSLYFRLSWDDGIETLANINFQLSFQTLFIFMIGLFSNKKLDCHPWSLAIGAATSFVYVFAIYFGKLRDCDTCTHNAGVSGILVQLAVVLVMEFIRRYVFPDYSQVDTTYLIFPNRPAWDVPRRARFGEKPLTPGLLSKMMEGVAEPLTNPWYSSLMFVTISMITPFVAPGIPANTEELEDTIIDGLPWWAVKMFSMAVLPTVLLLYALVRIPNQYSRPEDQKYSVVGTTEHSFSVNDLDVMEMTPEELGHRISYDQRNELVYERRLHILNKLGISPTEIDLVIRDKSYDSEVVREDGSHCVRLNTDVQCGQNIGNTSPSVGNTSQTVTSSEGTPVRQAVSNTDEGEQEIQVTSSFETQGSPSTASITDAQGCQSVCSSSV